jgi:predicted RNA-binding Zn-ribbon protein involved in translation (DUF1610 family)
MERASTTLEAEDRANELYWGSERSVNQIAEELDLSKGAFYAAIRPLAAGFGCPRCGREVAHTNRTRKDRSLVDCPACGWQGAEDDTLQEYLIPGARRRPSLVLDASSHRSPASTIWSPPTTDDDGPAPRLATDASSNRTLVTGAILGGAVGLALVLWARRR